MTIKDVEELTGVTRQNIRFYEREGLIMPRRNPENQYREYSMEDVRVLNQIRLYRKLDVSIEDIRKLKSRTLSLENCMDNCISNMEKEMARMTKMREVCEEVKRLGEDGLASDVDKTLERIEAYEKSGYHFADISKDYWNQQVVAEIRGLNRQAGIVLFWTVATSVFATMFYIALQRPRWLLLLPAGLIVRAALWFLWGRRNPAIVKKHIRFAHVPTAVHLAAAAVGCLLYPVILGSISLATLIHPAGLDTASLYSTGEFLWLGMIHMLDCVCYTAIFCILFYDTYRQKSVVSALCLSSILFAMLQLNAYAAAGYFFMGICLGILYEQTSSAAVCIITAVCESICVGAVILLEACLPGALPAYLVTEQTAGMHQMIPWTLLSLVLILALLFFTGLKSKKKIDWRLEWEKERSFCTETAKEAVIMDQSAYRKIEKSRKKSYRLSDGYLAAAVLAAIWIMVSNVV